MVYSYPFTSTDEQTKRTVWEKGEIVPDKDGKHWSPDEWRYDICGQPINYSEHGNTNLNTGWEIDHIKPTAKGGENTFENLQPLQWGKQQNKR